MLGITATACRKRFVERQNNVFRGDIIRISRGRSCSSTNIVCHFNSRCYQFGVMHALLVLPFHVLVCVAYLCLSLDVVDFAAPSEEEQASLPQVDCAGVVFFGLQTVLPLISSELLQVQRNICMHTHSCL